MSKAEEVFKAYDIRGIFPEDVNEELFRNIGRAFAIFIKNNDGNIFFCQSVCADEPYRSTTGNQNTFRNTFHISELAYHLLI